MAFKIFPYAFRHMTRGHVTKRMDSENIWLMIAFDMEDNQKSFAIWLGVT